MADNYVVERRTTIDATPGDLFDRVGNLQGWDDWSPWAEMDPDMDKTYTGESGTVGSSYSWTGNRKVGEGSMTITDITDDEQVIIDLRFLKPFKSQSVTEMHLKPAASGDGTEVTWRMTGEMTFMTKVMGLIGKNMDKMVGPDFEKGLAKLKRLAES